VFDGAVADRPGRSLSDAMTAQAHPPARPLRKDAARNRELLITAARELFAQRGLDVSLEDIAQHAGLGVGTAYRHFASKNEIASALLGQTLDAVVASGEQALTVEDPWRALVGFFEAAVAVQVGDRGLREVFLGVQDTGQIEYVHGRMTVIVTELVRRAQRAGVLRKDAAATDIGMIITMMSAVTEITADFAPDTWRRYLALCLAGLKPGAARLPLPALTEEQFRDAIDHHKKALRPTAKPAPARAKSSR
jgi:AcrR family transcriptional regulator